MAISFIGSATAATTTVAIPTTLHGDFIVIFAYDGSAATAPTLPTGWTNITNNTGNSNGFRVAYKFAATSDTSGTWTSATLLVALVYRGVAGIGASGSTTTASGLTTNMSGFTPQSAGGSSWAVSWGASHQITSMSTPAGTTLRATATGAADLGILVDSNGGVNSWALHTSTNGSAAVNVGGSFEMKPAFLSFNNYEAAKAEDNGNAVLSLGERTR